MFSQDTNNITIVVNTKDLASSVLKDINGNIKNLGIQTENSGESMTSSFFKANVYLEIFKKGVGLVTDASRELFEVLKSGARLEMLNTSLNVIAKNMGISSTKIEEFKKELEDVNTYGSKATSAIKAFVQTGLAGLIDDLTFASGEKGFKGLIRTIKDFAATAGVTSSEAIYDFSDAIVRTNPILLERYFTMRNLTFVYDDAAKKLGKNITELTEVEKRQAFLNEIIKEGYKVQGVYNETYETAGKNLLSIEDAASSLKEELGQALQPAFQFVTNGVLDLVKGIRKFTLESSPQLKAFSEGIKNIIEKIVNLIKDVFSGKLDQYINNFVERNKDNPIIKFFTEMFRIAQEVFPKISEWVNNAAVSVNNSLEGIRPAVESIIKSIQTVAEILSEILGPIITFLWDNILKPAFDWLSKNAGPIFKVFADIIAFVTSSIVGNLKLMWDSFKFVLNAIVKAFEGMATSISTALSGIWNAIQSVFKPVFNWIIDRVNDVIGFINKLINGASDISTALGGKPIEFRIGYLSKLEMGTDYWKGGIALVGEKGPELVNLPKGSKVTPANQTKNMNQSVNVINNFYNTQVDYQALSRNIGFLLKTI